MKEIISESGDIDPGGKNGASILKHVKWIILDGLVLAWVDGVVVEDVLQYLDLLRLRRPLGPEQLGRGRGPVAWVCAILILFMAHN